MIITMILFFTVFGAAIGVNIPQEKTCAQSHSKSMKTKTIKKAKKLC